MSRTSLCDSRFPRKEHLDIRCMQLASYLGNVTQMCLRSFFTKNILLTFDLNIDIIRVIVRVPK